jgi:hypothetical protein
MAELDGVSHLIGGRVLDVGDVAPEGAVGQHPDVLFHGGVFDGFSVLSKVVGEEMLDDKLVGKVGFPSGGEVHDGISGWKLCGLLYSNWKLRSFE